MKVHVIDCHYVQKEFANALILEASNGDWALIDPNTESAIPHIESAVREHGLKFENFKYLIVTHIHLDHAAATGTWARRFAAVPVLCHTRAQRHLVDPAKLITSAKTVYGEETFQKLYGEIEPIPESQVRVQKNESTVNLGDEILTFYETPGHAKHHVCIFSKQSRFLFSGDMCGVSYPSLRSEHFFVIPSTSPTDFNPHDALDSLARLESLNSVAVFPTHFGRIDSVRELFSEMRMHYQFTITILQEFQTTQKSIRGSDLITAIEERWLKYVQDWSKTRGFEWSNEQITLLSLDLRINAQGMAWAIEHSE